MLIASFSAVYARAGLPFAISVSLKLFPPDAEQAQPKPRLQAAVRLMQLSPHGRPFLQILQHPAARSTASASNDFFDCRAASGTAARSNKNNLIVFTLSHLFCLS